MEPAVLSVGALDKVAERRSRRTVPNWRLMAALGVNLGLWGGIYMGVKALLN